MFEIGILARQFDIIGCVWILIERPVELDQVEFPWSKLGTPAAPDITTESRYVRDYHLDIGNMIPVHQHEGRNNIPLVEAPELHST